MKSFKSFMKSFVVVEPLSDFDIVNKCKELQIQNFTGVFMRDELNKNKASDNECLVLNFDESSNEGTHWTCLFVQNFVCVYFDSFGFPPPIEVEQYCNQLSE